MDRKVRRKRKDSGQRSSELNKGNTMPKAKEQKTTKKDNVQDELSHAITFLLDDGSASHSVSSMKLLW